jgi:hypothetical protein
MVAVPDVYAVNFNPGVLGFYPDRTIELSYSNRYMLRELATQAATITTPAAKGAISSSLSYFGTEQFNQVQVSLGYGFKLSEWLGAGAALNGMSRKVQITGQEDFSVTGDIGLLGSFQRGFRFGLNMDVPYPASTGIETFPGHRSGLSFGVAYEKKDDFLLTSRISWEEYRRIYYSGGIEIFLTGYLAARVGVKLPSEATFSFGTGLYLKRWNINLGFSSHPVLGLSGSVSLSTKLTVHEKR